MTVHEGACLAPRRTLAPRFICFLMGTSEHLADAQVGDTSGTGHLRPRPSPDAATDELTGFLAGRLHRP